MQKTIALIYHALGSADRAADPHYAVTMPRFLEQLALCQRSAGAVVSAKAWLRGRNGVVFTFDDGHESHFARAFPALVAAGASADFFVNPAQTGTAGFATWSELREMAKAGMSIQSHGYDHSRYLTRLSRRELLEDLRRSRGEIEDRVGCAVELLAPPGGRSPPGLSATALEAGYTHVLDSRPGSFGRPPPRTLPRLAVTAELNQRTLASWLGGGRALLRAELRYAALWLAKVGLGDYAYERVRRMVMEGPKSLWR